MIIASTPKGVCYIAFSDEHNAAFNELKLQFPNARYIEYTDALQQGALLIFRKDWSALSTVKLHLKGTVFQLKVWEALLKIPIGSLRTYGAIAQKIEQPNAGRAVGTAIGNNPVAFLIPCHRVIRSAGEHGQYHWGTTRKSAMIAWEAAQLNPVVSLEQHANLIL